MYLPRPTGEYVEQMLAPNGWPGVDEDAYYDRAQRYTQVLRRVSDVLDSCLRERGEVFDGGVWSGSAAGAAGRQMGAIVEALTTLEYGLATVITWHRYIAGSIIEAKSDISDNVAGAHKEINALQNDSKLDPDERTAAINAVVKATHEANAGVVTETAVQILASKAWKPSDLALQDLLDQRTPPPDESSPIEPTPGDEPPQEDEKPRGDDGPPTSGPGAPGSGSGGGPGQSVPGMPWAGVPPVSPSTPPDMPGPAVPSGGPTAPAAPRKPAASAPSEDEGDGDEDPAAAPSAQPDGDAHDSSPRVAPAAATGMPAMPMAAPGAAAGGGGGALPVTEPGGGGSGAGSHGGTGVRPAAAATNRAASRRDPRARRESTDRGQSVEGAAMAAIPVSAARAERDAIADSATADAARRSGDRLQLARRIAAALNVPLSDGEQHFGFFWVTGLTTDGAIVVANNFGLAYLPEGFQLPEQVSMATADESIPAAERARWTTYPVLALQGWAAHRGAKLRAVIATQEQLADSDPGVTKVVIDADDIPDSGEMSGRSRLEVVDPAAAERLAETPDARLTALLPPARADAEAPADTPDDQRPLLWLQVLTPMVRSDPRRQGPHLRAFHAYATYTQEAALKEAHTAVDPVAQRCAVGDWLYWKRLTRLLDAALSAAS
jgi:hypothetical protein